MKFTFGICTTAGNKLRIENIIRSIELNNVPSSDCEVIVVGSDDLDISTDLNIRYFPFDESVKKGWITRKKNMITDNAIFPNIVYMHDYIVLEEGWYQSMCEFGEDWDLLMNKIVNIDNSRFRDWTLVGGDRHNLFVEEGTSRNLLPYNEKRLSKWMYFSGAYWLAKKKFMAECPLDEDLTWGEGEDVEWSYRAKEKTTFKLNENAVVRVNKPDKPAFFQLAKQNYLDDTYKYLVKKHGSLPQMASDRTREEY
jgi:hypothetical protein